jgi:uncharacterized phosphatase
MANSKVTIYFVRHGLSEANLAGITSGGEHDTTLTDIGREGAKKAGQELKDENIELIVASPMSRTMETATIIAGEIGYDPNKIIKNDKFIERLMGPFSGRPHTEYREFVEKGEHVEGVERVEEMVKRVSEGLEQLKALGASRIALVAHGGTGRVLKIISDNLHHSEMYKMDAFQNTAIHKFEI